MKRLSAANTLAEIDETLSPLPLTTAEELEAFYSEKYRQARGVDRMAHLGLKLTRAYNTRHFHAFVMGHPGVGKSTEISKLLLLHADQFLPIRISAAAEMYPGDFRIHDLLWLMTFVFSKRLARLPFRAFPTPFRLVCLMPSNVNSPNVGWKSWDSAKARWKADSISSCLPALKQH